MHPSPNVLRNDPTRITSVHHIILSGDIGLSPAVANSKSAGNGSAAGQNSIWDTLGRQLTSLMYPKRITVVVLSKWAEEVRSLKKYHLNHIVRKLRTYKHALEICVWMTTQPDISLLPGDYVVHLDLVLKVRGFTSIEKFFEDPI